MIDFYKLLQISPQADSVVIKAAYRAILLKLNKHPDKGGSSQEAQLLNEAYQTLMDPTKRNDYDQRYFLLHNHSSFNREEPPSKIVRCHLCSSLNRIVFTKEVKEWKCGRCSASLHPLKDENTLHDRANQTRHQICEILKREYWSIHEKTDPYFDTILENRFFLRNMVFIKSFNEFDIFLCHEFNKAISQTIKRFGKGKIFQGFYFIAVADTIKDKQIVLNKFKYAHQTTQTMFKTTASIIIGMQSREFHLSHSNLSVYPDDIRKIQETLFIEKTA